MIKFTKTIINQQISLQNTDIINQHYSTIKDTINKWYKKPKKSIKQKTKKRDFKKKKNKTAIQEKNTNATAPESQPTPASIGL